MDRYRVPDPGSIEFVASVGMIHPGGIASMVDHLEEDGYLQETLGRLMFCPLTASPGTTSATEHLSEQYDIRVLSDSGGYESQVNDEYSMRDIYQFDKQYYLENDWIDEYVLPDVVPVAADDEQTVEHKVQDTISLARMLYRELPESKQRRAVPVVQGHTRQQIVDCLDAYTELNRIEKVGFGSFSTGGVNGGVNQLTENNIELLQFVVHEAHKHDLDVHAFGIGGPTSVPILQWCGVDTFDSTGWVRSAGYGNVFFPFKSRVNITHLRNRSGESVFASDFAEIKRQTGHDCPYCASFTDLKDDRTLRVLHNLVVMHEVTDRAESQSPEDLLDIMNPNSRYTTYLQKLTAS